MKSLIGILYSLALLALVSCSSNGGTVTVSTVDPSSKRVAYAKERLEHALQQASIPDGEWQIVLQERNQQPKEGFSIVRKDRRITITGNDGSGVIYGVNEFIERSLQGMDESCWTMDKAIQDAPEMVLRGCCIGQQKPNILEGRQVYEYPLTPELFPWFYDKEQWIKYLDMLVDNRMNSLYLWNGHPFASLVRLEDYPFAVEVDSVTFAKNEEIYSFLTEEADKRGIFVIQMFYNIIVSKPFAEHYGIKTQERQRPIDDLLSDYTRKSIAAFVKKYPNVGLLVCLGEAMDTYEDDVNWMCHTIIPGLRDGLDALAAKDPKYIGYEPPLLLRAHDTDCKMVMEAALPLYHNLYTMHKYNGESLTTYQPRGPWTDIHRGLSELGSTHIENVHILANLEPWRWSSPLFIRRVVGAMHSEHGANALHLYPQASYWDYPYTADMLPDGERELQIDRDWMWYQAWGRYAWHQGRDSLSEDLYWDRQIARHYSTNLENADLMRRAYDASGEIAPKLLRRFGITEGNRQTLLLGMLCSQLVNPYKYTVYPGFYESCGPEGEKLIEWVEKEWKEEPHIGELPLDIVDQCVAHGETAVAAIDSVNVRRIDKSMRMEFLRLRNDMYCYRAFAYSFKYKVMACRKVLDYRWSHDIHYLEEAIPLLEQSLSYWRELVGLTKDTYRYANSMQTAQRRIPVGGDDGKNLHWSEMLPHYEKELDCFRQNLQTLQDKASGIDTIQQDSIVPLRPLRVTLSKHYYRGRLEPGSVVILDKPQYTVKAVAPELANMYPLLFDYTRTRKENCVIEFDSEFPVQLLMGYYRDDQQKYAQAPKLETDATANDYGQAEPVLESAILIKGLPLVNVHSYHFPAGHNSFTMPKGLSLVIGFTTDSIKPRNVGLAGNSETMEWLFN